MVWCCLLCASIADHVIVTGMTTVTVCLVSASVTYLYCIKMTELIISQTGLDGSIRNLVTDRISVGGNAITSFGLSIRAYVCPLFCPLYLRNRLTVDLELCVWVCYDHS